MHYIVITRSYC